MSKILKKLARLAFVGMIAVSAVSVPVYAATCQHEHISKTEEIVGYSGATSTYHIVTVKYGYTCDECGIWKYEEGTYSYTEDHDYEMDYSTGKLYCTICGDHY